MVIIYDAKGDRFSYSDISLFRTNVNVILWIAGTAVSVSGILIFSLAVYTMRDSWRAGIPENDKTEIVTFGIYSISRNPAFLGLDLVYIGILILFFNWIHLGFVIFAIIMLHLQILQEEKFLQTVFGGNYIQYKAQVGRYIGRIYK